MVMGWESEIRNDVAESKMAQHFKRKVRRNLRFQWKSKEKVEVSKEK